MFLTRNLCNVSELLALPGKSKPDDIHVEVFCQKRKTSAYKLGWPLYGEVHIYNDPEKQTTHGWKLNGVGCKHGYNERS